MPFAANIATCHCGQYRGAGTAVGHGGSKRVESNENL